MKSMFASAPVMFALATFFWASNTIIGKAADTIVPAFTLSFWRWSLALVIIAPLAIPHIWKEKKFYLQNWRILLILGISNVALYNTLQYWALNWTSATNVGILSAALPVFIFFFSWALSTETINRFKMLGLIVAMIGVGVVISRGDASIIFQLALNKGDGLMLLAVFSFGIYSVLLRKLSPKFHPLGFVGVTIFIGWVCVIPFYAWDITHETLPSLTPTLILMLVYLAIFPSIISQLCWFRGVRIGGANLGGIFYNLLPVYASVMAVMFLGETFTLIHLAGMILIIIGVYIATVIGNR